VADPWGWRSELEAWEERFGDEVVLEWPTNATARMGPACDRFYTAVREGNLSHDGDHRLAAHVAHAHVKTTTYGGVIVKDGRGSPRKIDAAVASVVAFDRAAQLPPRKRRRAYSF
jgi:phage terminase large subunit-like protein